MQNAEGWDVCIYGTFSIYEALNDTVTSMFLPFMIITFFSLSVGLDAAFLFALFAFGLCLSFLLSYVGGYKKSRNTFIQFSKEGFLFQKPDVFVSYAWDCLQNPHFVERIDGIKTCYFTADVIETAPHKEPEKQRKTVKILLEGFKSPSEEIGKLMIEHARAARL